MRKKICLKIFIPIIIAAIALPILVLGRDYGADYDELFGGENGFTIHTNESINTSVDSNSQLSTLVQKFVGRYYTGNIYEGDNTYTYSASTNDCNYENMTCNISVNRYTIVNDMHSSGEVFKEYKDVKINIDNNVMDYFGTILNSNGDMIIKYDDSFFADVTERDNYIRQYVSSKSFSNSDGNWVSFSYDAGLGLITYEVNGENFKDNFTARVLVNSIQFDKTETEFSDNFKKLSTDGTLTIKTNGDITNTMLSDYLMHKHVYVGSTTFSFEADGDIVDNKVYIEMKPISNDGSQTTEKHLITLAKDTNIDKTKFALVNMRDEVVIPALAPTEDYQKSNYINRYFNAIEYRQVNIDKSNYYNFDKIYGWNGEPDNYIRYIQYSNDTGEAVDIQYNMIDIKFSDYSDTYSEEFRTKFGNGLTIRSDEASENAVINAIGNNGVLSCNEDVSVCDIGLSHNDEMYVEIHKVNITFDNSITDNFKRLFNLNEDGTINVVTDTDLDSLSYVSYYNYNDDEDVSLEYAKEGNKFVLSLNAFSSNGNYEKHSVDYKIVNSGPTAFYKNNVYLTKDFYPGESTRIWNEISHSHYFAKDQRSGANASAMGCDKSTGKCKVMLLNNDRNLEIHDVQANIKTGKSPEFAKAFPEDSVHINAIYKDDEMYLYGASSAYFMSKTKDWVYLSDFTESTAKLTYNNLEVHSFEVDYAQSNAQHAAAVAEAKNKLKGVELSSERKDLEFVNKFYYGGEFILSSTNFNSKTLNDNFNKAVKNRHIGYYVVPEGGGGTPYSNGAAGRLVLFYDGVAYDVLEQYVDFTNYNVIYVPTDTEKTPEAYVRAAQKRVDQYLGKDSGVVISYNGPVIEDYFNNDETYERYGINKATFDNNEYRISYKNSSSLMLIVADSSKMQKPDFAASDVTNNINVTSETVNYPSNTVVMSEVVDKEDSEYSKILEKAKVKNAHIVDINLYSSSVGDIDDFDGAEFNVSVPIEDEDLHDKDLVAYYIDDEGNVEEHPVVMDDFMATFETTHFSTYIIAEKTKADNIGDAAQDVIKNPNTGDNILTYILLLVLSGTVVGTASYRFIKREN